VSECKVSINCRAGGGVTFVGVEVQKARLRSPLIQTQLFCFFAVNVSQTAADTELASRVALRSCCIPVVRADFFKPLGRAGGACSAAVFQVRLQVVGNFSLLSGMLSKNLVALF